MPIPGPENSDSFEPFADPLEARRQPIHGSGRLDGGFGRGLAARWRRWVAPKSVTSARDAEKRSLAMRSVVTDQHSVRQNSLINDVKPGSRETGAENQSLVANSSPRRQLVTLSTPIPLGEFPQEMLAESTNPFRSDLTTVARVNAPPVRSTVVAPIAEAPRSTDKTTEKLSAPSPVAAATKPPELLRVASSTDRPAVQTVKEERPAPEVLALGRVALCDEIRSYEDFTETNARVMSAGQPVLIYATLQNFKCLPSKQGYRTVTHSTVELRQQSGELLATVDLGTATDLSRSQRHDYFLTHRFAIPNHLAAGCYTLRLLVEDLTTQQTSSADVRFIVKGDQPPPRETGDSEESVTPPGTPPKLLRTSGLPE